MAFRGDTWLSSHDGCEALSRNIMEKITLRNQQQRNSAMFTKLNAEIRPLLKKFTSEIGQLRQSLNQASLSYQITTEEANRRQRMLDSLSNKERQIELSLNSVQSTGRTALLGHQPITPQVSSWADEESEATRNLTVQDIRETQQQVIAAQDRGLDGLSRILTRQKEMAITIGGELEVQNEIIEDIIDHTDATHDRLTRETRNVTIVTRKSGSCCYWVIILVLLIGLIVVVALPRKF